MTKLLDQAVEAARALPPKAQDAMARVMLNMVANEGPPEEIDPAHLADVLEGLAEARRGEFATDEEVAAAFRAFRP